MKLRLLFYKHLWLRLLASVITFVLLAAVINLLTNSLLLAVITVFLLSKGLIFMEIKGHFYRKYLTLDEKLNPQEQHILLNLFKKVNFDYEKVIEEFKHYNLEPKELIRLEIESLIKKNEQGIRPIEGAGFLMSIGALTFTTYSLSINLANDEKEVAFGVLIIYFILLILSVFTINHSNKQQDLVYYYNHILYLLDKVDLPEPAKSKAEK